MILEASEEEKSKLGKEIGWKLRASEEIEETTKRTELEWKDKERESEKRKVRDSNSNRGQYSEQIQNETDSKE